MFIFSEPTLGTAGSALTVWRIVRDDMEVVKEAIEKLLPPLEELEKALAEPETDTEKSKK